MGKQFSGRFEAEEIPLPDEIYVYTICPKCGRQFTIGKYSGKLEDAKNQNLLEILEKSYTDEQIAVRCPHH